ncbi:hypothetical protein [Pelagibacterium sp.]|uniref:hypothetical protein n=1 Tax=Pelagibacterium sp. TaxID=1967288 RepID=UPI003C799D06
MSFPEPRLPTDPWARRCYERMPRQRTFAEEMQWPIAQEILASLLDDDRDAMLSVEGRKNER